eukprot:5997206-Amphidinium_carterae.2
MGQSPGRPKAGLGACDTHDEAIIAATAQLPLTEPRNWWSATEHLATTRVHHVGYEVCLLCPQLHNMQQR